MSGLDPQPDADQEASPARAAGDVVEPAEPTAILVGRKARSYLALLDFASQPRSKVAWFVRLAAIGVALFALGRRVVTVTTPLLAAKPPPAIPTEEIDDYKFRLPERIRREIFSELAAAELAERARAIRENTWKGHVWSREDDRGHYERLAARRAAARHKVSLSQVYLVLDEGLREGWPGPDGKPLPATTPPLDIRTGW